MPASTRWARQTDAAVDKLHRAAQEVLSVSAPGTALARDAAFLAAAVAAAADERQRVPLQQALDSLQRTSGKLLLPQVLLLSSKTAGVWGMHCTAHLAADSNAAPFIDKMRRSFHLSVKQQHLSSEQAQLRREGDALPSLDHVELQHDTATAVAAPVPAPGKAQPPSKRRRTALQELWHVLLPILVAMGLEKSMCHYKMCSNCKVEAGQVYCNNTLQLINEGNARRESCLTTNILIDILSYFASTANNALAPYREQLQAVADINPAPTVGASALPSGSRPAAEALAFASSVAGASQAAAAGATAVVLPEPVLPAGALERGGVAVVRVDQPSFDLLAECTKHNNKGKRNALLPRTLEINQSGVGSASIDSAALFAVLRTHGGLHLVRARGALLRALRSMPGHEAFPPTAALVSVVNQRITHWLLPVYGYNAEEELGTLSPEALKEVIERGISAGTLGGPAGSVTVREPFADRSLLLAAMQQRGIKLARYDVVGEEAVPVDRLWPSLILHGGARQVACEPAIAATVAESLGCSRKTCARQPRG
ncbi:HAD family hydrolase [Micractinium conductrix]|uniref:HAD family hydrolase n=1 Tax=Micractinium conductrix TaxID=554055 RepID=A0A2P6UZL5_9CHLO|nr:HAD family hydrolase [Micractinium conductrix]|eukprot:PSC67273.1 HAD family hydrolase [Micractinium conductrix]